MRKIPTLFKRDPDNVRHVLPEVTPGCEWVLDGEGVPTRKYDGTCVMLDQYGDWWARRQVKPEGRRPMGFRPVETDLETNKVVGWEPMDQSPFAQFHAEALESFTPTHGPGTFELVGPKINGNPEHAQQHTILRHGHEAVEIQPEWLNHDGLRALLLDTFGALGWEGIVWHHPDGRMAKLKRKDFT